MREPQHLQYGDMMHSTAMRFGYVILMISIGFGCSRTESRSKTSAIPAVENVHELASIPELSSRRVLHSSGVPGGKYRAVAIDDG